MSPWHLQHQTHGGLHSYFLRTLKTLVTFLLVALGLCCCEQGLSGAVSSGHSPVAVLGLLVAASPVVERGSGCMGFGAAALSSCDAWAWLLCGMQNLARLGVQPLSCIGRQIRIRWTTRKSSIAMKLIRDTAG